MLRFLFTGRWLALLLLVYLVGFACVELGLWHFRRYEGKVEGNKVVQTAIDTLIDQTKTIERVIASLDIGKIELEGSDSLDNPNAVFQ